MQDLDRSNARNGAANGPTPAGAAQGRQPGGIKTILVPTDSSPLAARAVSCGPRSFLIGGILILGIAFAWAFPPPNLPSDPGLRAVRPVEEIIRGPRTRHFIALTFDAGGETTELAELLAALDTAKVHGTFFLTGDWASQHRDLTKDIYSRGHEIGNHTWSHLDLTKLDDQHVRTELLRSGTLLNTMTGHPPRPLFRAPFGARNARVLRIVGESGYTSVYWTLDSLDSIDPPKTPEFLIARLTGRPNFELEGAIILMHVGEPATAAALPAILADFQRRGFRIGTISELLSPR
jgi:peptidoglycan/xylan/chitin deacetylase (PgdA/CDA1 family)